MSVACTLVTREYPGHITILPARSSTTTTSGNSIRPFQISLKDALPKDYSQYYCQEVMQDKAHLTESGRPRFTERPVVDWKKNDIRSLLIVDELKPQWGGRLPEIAQPGYRLIYLPLDASDDEIVDALVRSDIYKEHNFDQDFLVQTARYTVHAARERAYHRHKARLQRLTKPEWRNVIENYLLNLGCEAQCRLEYKRTCLQLKKQKMEQQNLHQQSLQNQGQQGACAVKRSQSNYLLKKAILTSLSTSPDFPGNAKFGLSSISQTVPRKVTLSRQEKQAIWVQVQTKLYQHLGLDWEADKLV